MNQKFTIDQYEICMTFKNDNVLVASAQYSPTGEYFLSGTVELTRIKKDTIIATLERKSQKHLRCEIEQLVEEKSKCLVMKFIVSFDFLPEFSEEIRLDYVEKKESIKTMQVNNFKAEIDQMERMLDAFEKNGVSKHEQLHTMSSNNQKPLQMKKMQLARGKYLVRISGVYTNSLGQMGNSDKLTFLFTVPGKLDKLKKTVTMYSISGYSYPFFLSEILDCSQGEVVLEVEGAAANWNLTNTHVLTCPIADLK